MEIPANLLPADAGLDALREFVEQDPQWVLPNWHSHGLGGFLHWEHATVKTVKFLGTAILDVRIPASDYEPAEVRDRFHREALHVVRAAQLGLNPHSITGAELEQKISEAQTASADQPSADTVEYGVRSTGWADEEQATTVEPTGTGPEGIAAAKNVARLTGQWQTAQGLPADAEVVSRTPANPEWTPMGDWRLL
ncbi:hypothetical protein AB0395_48245 [Streptosporangium sp. NPDC051023]|uniref:hypothetical protein n=1 Tax=Streptosporangium sp. NPDC051023 TaxID=3155410 RepID=UPI0034501C3B